jgi:hypothetical protein
MGRVNRNGKIFQHMGAITILLNNINAGILYHWLLQTLRQRYRLTYMPSLFSLIKGPSSFVKSLGCYFSSPSLSPPNGWSSVSRFQTYKRLNVTKFQLKSALLLTYHFLCYGKALLGLFHNIQTRGSPIFAYQTLYNQYICSYFHV